MSACLKNKIILFLGIAAVLAGCDKRKASYDVLFIGLPREVSVEKAQFNLIYYILTQTHEPLFRKDDGENFSSRVLSKWARSIDSSEYRFCPNTSLDFGAAHKFTEDYFTAYISRTTKRFSNDFRVIRTGSCFDVRFRKPEKNYLDFLTLLDNAPTLRRTPRIEDGLGPFYIDSFGDSKVVLKRKDRVVRGYNEIIMWEYTGANDPRLLSREIEDFNLIYSYQVPDWVKREYTKFDVMDLKSVGLVLNHPDQAVRERIYNCVDIDAFREAFYPNKTGFQYIRTILPMGIPGAESGRPLQNCSQASATKESDSPIIFADWGQAAGASVDSFWKDFGKKTALHVISKKYTVQEISDCLDKNKRKTYNILPVVIDTSGRNDPLAFFDIFVGKRFFDFVDADIEKKYKKMISEPNAEEKGVLSVAINNVIRRRMMALPLYQSVSSLYYPAYIKNISVGRKMSRYPEIGDFRW